MFFFQPFHKSLVEHINQVLVGLGYLIKKFWEVLALGVRNPAVILAVTGPYHIFRGREGEIFWG